MIDSVATKPLSPVAFASSCLPTSCVPVTVCLIWTTWSCCRRQMAALRSLIVEGTLCLWPPWNIRRLDWVYWGIGWVHYSHFTVEVICGNSVRRYVGIVWGDMCLHKVLCCRLALHYHWINHRSTFIYLYLYPTITLSL